MPDIHTPEKIEELPVSIIKSMVNLSTAGFGVVVALAWNQFIQKLVEDYINPYLGKNTGIISLFIYAVIMTILAVIVTMQLIHLQRKLEEVQERIWNAREKRKTNQTN